MYSLVGEWLCRAGSGVLSSRRTGSGCRVDAVVVYCVAPIPCCRTPKSCGGSVVQFEKSRGIQQVEICIPSINEYG